MKRINEGEDVSFFLSSKAYADIITFVLQLNVSIFPHKVTGASAGSLAVEQYELSSGNTQLSPNVLKLKNLVTKLRAMIEEAPPDSGKHRFGNPSFRKWYDLVKQRSDALLSEHMPEELSKFDNVGDATGSTARAELKAYFLGSFGSAQRLDYGTGHELSFLAFLGGIWKLGGFGESADGAEERAIVLAVFEP